MNISSIKEAKEYLESFSKPIVFRKISLREASVKDPLDRMRLLLKLLENPQNKFKSIQVSGTSGKGSTSYYISHILATAGYKVGLTISPHLVSVNERIQISRDQKNIRACLKSDESVSFWRGNDLDRISGKGMLSVACGDLQHDKILSKRTLRQISDREFVELLNLVVPAIEKMKKTPEGEPSYFEITMAMSFLYFAKQTVEIAVVEVGIEGKYDASNTLNPFIAVLTNIDLDHTDILGETVEQITKEAVSIIKATRGPVSRFPPASARSWDDKSSSLRAVGSPSTSATPRYQIVITGVKNRSVIKIIEGKCREEGAELLRIDKDFSVKINKESIRGTRFDFIRHSGGQRPIESVNKKILSLRSRMTDLMLSMRGEYQIENAAVAIETVFALEKLGFRISEQHIRKALSTAYFPGRFEILNLPVTKGIAASSFDKFRTPRNDKTLILDGAHNPLKMKAFITSLEKLYSNYKKVFVIAFKGNKDIKSMIKEIVEVADVIIATEFQGSIGYVSSGAIDVSSIKYQVSILRQAQDKNKKLKIYSEYEFSTSRHSDLSRIPTEDSGQARTSDSGVATLPRMTTAKLVTEKDPKKALEKAIQIATVIARSPDLIGTTKQSRVESLIVVTGSLYLVGEVKKLLSSNS